jgi:uncharacterized membrane protein
MNPADYLRVLNLILCITCILILSNRWRKNRFDWNAKTRDYWYSFLAWSFAGAEISVQGIVEHNSLSARTILVTMASAVTMIGLRRKGAWGTDNDR